MLDPLPPQSDGPATHSCPCGKPVRVTGPIATGFAFGPPECNLAYHWGCAARLRAGENAGPSQAT